MIVKLAILMFSSLYRVLDAKNNMDFVSRWLVKLMLGSLTKTVM